MIVFPKLKLYTSLFFNISSWCRNVCLGLEDLQYVFMISSHELSITLLKDEERQLLVDQMRKRSPRVNLCIKPVTSFYDIPGESSWLRFWHILPLSMFEAVVLIFFSIYTNAGN